MFEECDVANFLRIVASATERKIARFSSVCGLEGGGLKNGEERGVLWGTVEGVDAPRRDTPRRDPSKADGGGLVVGGCTSLSANGGESIEHVLGVVFVEDQEGVDASDEVVYAYTLETAKLSARGVEKKLVAL